MFTITRFLIASLFSSLALASPFHDHGKRAEPYGTILYSCVGANKVALTFDDGPWIYTSGVLDKLKAANMRATFFINGDNYDSIYNYNSTVRRYITDGHQIGSHTWSHQDLATLSVADITLQMTMLEDALMAILGYFPFYMRVPFLSYSTTVLSTLATLKYVVVDSDINPQDWKYNTPSTVATANAQFNTQLTAGGGLAELHDVQSTTNSDVVPYIINLLQSRGLTSIPVGECFGDPKNNWYRTNRVGGYPPVSSSPAASTATSTAATSSSSAPTTAPTTTAASSSSSAVASSSTSTSSVVTTPTGVVSPDSSCGGANRYICPPGKCCSKYGWCGSTAAYCTVASGCQSAFGICGTIAPGGTSPDGTCGAANGYVCPNGLCCSTYGHCGTGSAYCAASSGCQAAYGAACT